MSDAPKLNPFPYPSPFEKVLLRELVQVATLCYQRGWAAGTAGNYSLRGSHGLLWQSPSGLNKGNLNPEHFIPVAIASGRAVEPSARQPSLEMPVHLGVYRAVPHAQCVVHAHPPNLVKRGRAAKNLQFQGEEMQKALGSLDHLRELHLPVLSNPTPTYMLELAEQLATQLVAGVPLIILAAHGIYAWGRTPMEALSFVEAAEFLCQTTVS